MPLFSPAAAKPAATSLRFRPSFELLEGRAIPSTLDPPLDPPTGDPVLFTLDGAPQIVNFTANQIGDGLYVFTGQVKDANPAGLVITFDGVPTMHGQSTTTDTNGVFSFTMQLRTDGTDVGTVSASTVNAQNVASNEAIVLVNPTP